MYVENIYKYVSSKIDNTLLILYMMKGIATYIYIYIICLNHQHPRIVPSFLAVPHSLVSKRVMKQSFALSFINNP
jgi:hypothetical protein